MTCDRGHISALLELIQPLRKTRGNKRDKLENEQENISVSYVTFMASLKVQCVPQIAFTQTGCPSYNNSHQSIFGDSSWYQNFFNHLIERCHPRSIAGQFPRAPHSDILPDIHARVRDRKRKPEREGHGERERERERDRCLALGGELKGKSR